MITANGETDYTKTSMRFGYDFKLPADTTFDSCAWYYGTTANDLRLSLTPGANTKKIEIRQQRSKVYPFQHCIYEYCKS